ncbi:MAG: SPOR domain-containing protein, partial [Bdellovibrionales bacterium]|nr:SPOR domain-containing protein [Bdellovibrionales bacterium]
MEDNYKTKHEKEAEGTPFTNGVFVGLLFGILVSIAVTLFITNGKSPFI